MGTKPSRPAPLRQAVDLATLWQLGVALPVLRVISEYPEFLLAHHAGPADAWWLTGLLCIVLPAALLGLILALRALRAGLGHGAYMVVMAGLCVAALLTLPAESWKSPVLLGMAALLGLALAWAYFRTFAGRWFVVFLAPAIVVVPAWFLIKVLGELTPPPEPQARQHAPLAADTPPIVFVVFDELPTWALLGPEGDINGALYPNFDALAREAYWFPNATTVATSTALALPSLLTGRHPVDFKMPNRRSYPDNLFTWLGKGMEMHVVESVTHLCPRKWCADAGPAARLDAGTLLADVAAIWLGTVWPDSGFTPGMGRAWKGFWQTRSAPNRLYEHRLAQMDRFVAGIEAVDRPVLHFLHANFPHVPYEYLPSGHRYPDGWRMPGLDPVTDTWQEEPQLVRSALRRFLLQLRATDAWLGRLIERLQEEGLYEDAIIVITADHGVSFQPGWSRRDAPPAENLDGYILPVPLIIKVPGQSAGAVIDDNAQAVDVLPTLADLLERPLAGGADGQSLLAPGSRSTDKRAVHGYRELASWSGDVAGTIAALASARQANPFAATSRPRDLFRDGPHAGWVGRPLAMLDAINTPGLTVRVERSEEFDDVDPASGYLPALVQGSIDWPGHATADLAIALNGRIEAVTPVRMVDDRLVFSALLPASAFQTGRNQLRVMVLSVAEDGAVTLRVGRQGAPPLRWALGGRRQALRRDDVALQRDSSGLRGALDFIGVDAAGLDIMGWAVDVERATPVDQVVVFVDGEFRHAGPTPMFRDESRELGVEQPAGFQVVLPVTGAESTGDVRVFAVTGDGRYRELRPNR